MRIARADREHEEHFLVKRDGSGARKRLGRQGWRLERVTRAGKKASENVGKSAASCGELRVTSAQQVAAKSCAPRRNSFPKNILRNARFSLTSFRTSLICGE